MPLLENMVLVLCFEGDVLLDVSAIGCVLA